MTRPSGRSIALVLGTGPEAGATIAALRLAEQAVARGHRVAVYAYGDGVRTGATGSSVAGHVAALVREGVHGGLVSWVADAGGSGTERGGAPEGTVTGGDPAGAVTGQVAGVVAGDGGDLWRFVRDADVVLGVSR